MKKLLLITVIAAVCALLPASGASATPVAPQRVIVELALPANASAEQIASATDALLATLPVGGYTVTNRYTTLPYVGLSAGSLTLSVLQHSGLVAQVYRDEAVSAASKPAKKCKASKKKGKKKRRCKKS